MNSNRDKPTYAQVTKIPNTRTFSKKRLEIEMAIIYPTEDKEGGFTDDLIKKSINPAWLKVGIKRFKKGIKDGILMEVNTREVLEKLGNEVNTNENL